MIRRATVAMMTTTICCVYLFVTTDRGTANQTERTSPPAFKPVMPINSLMIEQDRHFETILRLLRNPDAPETPANLTHAALALGEMANINGYQPRAIQREDYRGWAEQLKNQALELALLAKTKNLDDAKKLARQINKTCKACHDKYEE